MGRFQRLQVWALRRVFTDSYIASKDRRVQELEAQVQTLAGGLSHMGRYQALLERLVMGEPPTYCAQCRDFAQFSARWLINLSEEQKATLMDRSPAEVGKFLYDVWLEIIPREAAKTAFSSWIECGEWPEIGKVDLDKSITEVLTEEPELVKRFKAGETKLAGPLIGKIVKKCKGTSTVDEIKKRMMEKLK
jgi:hypothetical protein